MKATRVIGLTVALFTAIALSSPVMTVAADRTVYGELVRMDGNNFRIVGNNGTFSAPAGVSLYALDGRAVEVYLTNGRVEQIVERPVPIQPIAHGFGTARGQVVVVDPINRTFKFAGDDTTVYAAPPGIDISLYGGKLVELKTDESGRVTTLALVGESPGGTGYVAPATSLPPPVYVPPAGTTGCLYGGEVYSVGSTTCQSGISHRCEGTQWMSMSAPCGPTAGYQASDSPASPPRSCMIGDATVANGSSICRSGTMFRCDDGAWMNAGTACR